MSLKVQRKKRARQASASPVPIVALAAGAIIFIIGGLIVAKLVTGGAPAAQDTGGAVSPTVAQELANVPWTVGNSVGKGSATGLPSPVSGEPLRGAGGQPQIAYFGAEYCPFCAAQRWAMIVALDRFGTFSNLHTARSASDDVYASTPTFSFYGSSFQSDYVDFHPI